MATQRFTALLYRARYSTNTLDEQFGRGSTVTVVDGDVGGSDLPVMLDLRLRQIVMEINGVASPRFATPEDACGQCGIACDQLIDAIRSHSIASAERLWLTGLRDPSRALREALGNVVYYALDDRLRREEHCVVVVDPVWDDDVERCLVGGSIIDLTRQQFDHRAASPTIYSSIQDVGEHWRAYFSDGENRSVARLLQVP